jgi:rod shape-determining protein MreC
VWKLVKRWRSALPLLLAGLLALFIIKAPWRARSASEREAGRFAAWLASAPATLTRGLRDSSSRLKSLWDAETRARQLEEELALLRLEYRQLEESYQRSLSRSHSLQIKSRYLTHLIPAMLLARDPGTWFQVILLDKGKDDGVAAGAGVMSPQGVVGKVVGAQATACKAVFLTDPSCRLSVRDARSRVLAILSGDGRKACRLEYVSGQDDVKVGDLIETAPGSLSFPSGIPAGTVTRVLKVDNGLKLAVEVQPSAELNRLDGLFIAGGKGPE